MRLEGLEDFRQIGSGGFSTVYSARQTELDRDVAVKVLESRQVDVGSVEREIVALGRLSGIPNIITAYELRVLDDGRPALIMALMSTSLGDLVRQGADHTQSLVERWLPQVAASLDAAHTRNVFHRDLKPDNILISDAGDAYLADFGISGVDTLEPGTETAHSLTPQHASPERLAAEVNDPVADDIYSFGSSIYTSLSGRAPFGTAIDGGVSGLIRRITYDEVPPIDGLPAATNEVLRRVLAKDPTKRYGSASEFATELAATTAGSAGMPIHLPVDDGDLTHRRLPSTTPTHRDTPAVPPAAAISAATVSPENQSDSGARDLTTVEPVAYTHDRHRRRVTATATVALLIVSASAVGWFATRGDGAPTVESSGDATDVAEWRGQFRRLMEAEDTPDGLIACMADRLAQETTEPAKFVDEFAADADALNRDDPGVFREGSEERAAAVEALERDCVPEVIAIGTDLTVTGNATQVALTRDSACALLQDGTSACWGSNWDELAFNEDGLGPMWIEYPVESRAPPAKQLVAAPFSSRCVISLDDELHCLNSVDNDLQGNNGDKVEPDLYGTNTYLVASDSIGEFTHMEWAGKVRDAALGDRHACVVRTDGTVWCVGSNEFGQLGDGTRNDSIEPVRVQGLAQAVSVVAGTNHTCAGLADESVWCWGVNGITLTSWDVSPVRIEQLPPIAQMSAGRGFTCGVGIDESLWCWGGMVEVVGNRALKGTRGPVRIDTDVGATQVDVFELRSCFTSTGNEILCFGDGRPLPERIDNISDVVQVSISEFVTCAADRWGEVDCVGRVGELDEYGQPTVDDNVFIVPGLGNQ